MLRFVHATRGLCIRSGGDNQHKTHHSLVSQSVASAPAKTFCMELHSFSTIRLRTWCTRCASAFGPVNASIPSVTFDGQRVLGYAGRTLLVPPVPRRDEARVPFAAAVGSTEEAAAFSAGRARFFDAFFPLPRERVGVEASAS